METIFILIGCRQFWSQICGQTACRTPNIYYQRSLSSVNLLGKQVLLWNQHQAKTPKTVGRNIRARIYTSGTTQVSI